MDEEEDEVAKPGNATDSTTQSQPSTQPEQSEEEGEEDGEAGSLRYSGDPVRSLE